MQCDVEFTDEFELWWEQLDEAEQISVAACVGLLEKNGTALRYPYSSGISGSRHAHMRELRMQHRGRPYRVFYAFDPQRHAILLIGGVKSGNQRWYEQYVPLADKLYDDHLDTLSKEAIDHGKEV